MPNPARGTARPSTALGSPDSDPGTLEELVGDCRRIAPRFAAREKTAAEPVPPSRIHGTSVSDESAHAVDEMSDYGS